MIKFREKQYTIQEGHYTGPKDLDHVPGYFETMGTGALIGGGIGALVSGGKEVYERSRGPEGRPDGNILSSMYGGYRTGGRYGLGAGLLAKVLLNVIHNPMKDVKFAEVDRNIRARFGMFQASGFTVGDTMDRRNKYDEKFATNDRDVTLYKINVAIQDGKVMMYVLNLSDEELKKLNNTLDYYCKKYYGMDYQSGVLNATRRNNSYYVDIRFTNYQVIGDFLTEVSEVLMVKINLLNSKAIIENRLNDDFESFQPKESDELKTFSSVPTLSKLDVIELLTKGGLGGANIANTKGFGKKDGITAAILDSVTSIIGKFNTVEDALVFKGKVRKADLGNKYLESAFKECNFIEEIHYTVGRRDVPFNMYLHKGDLIICVAKNDIVYKKFIKIYDNSKFYNRNDLGQAIMCTYSVISKDDLRLLLRKIVSSGIVPNIYLI